MGKILNNYTQEQYEQEAILCNKSGNTIEIITPHKLAYVLEPNEYVSNGNILINKDYDKELVDERINNFYNNFISLSIGNYRKKPKGYSSAIESFNTMDSFVSKLGKLPANTIVVYHTPDFTDKEQCSEEYLEANKIYIPELTKEQFDSLYIEFVTKWNTEEHKENI